MPLEGSNAIQHNPWRLQLQQKHLQRMKENAKHRNQYSILSAWNNHFEHQAIQHLPAKFVHVLYLNVLLCSTAYFFALQNLVPKVALQSHR